MLVRSAFVLFAIAWFVSLTSRCFIATHIKGLNAIQKLQRAQQDEAQFPDEVSSSPAMITKRNVRIAQYDIHDFCLTYDVAVCCVVLQVDVHRNEKACETFLGWCGLFALFAVHTKHSNQFLLQQIQEGIAIFSVRISLIFSRICVVTNAQTLSLFLLRLR